MAITAWSEGHRVLYHWEKFSENCLLIGISPEMKKPPGPNDSRRWLWNATNGSRNKKGPQRRP